MKPNAPWIERAITFNLRAGPLSKADLLAAVAAASDVDRVITDARDFDLAVRRLINRGAIEFDGKTYRRDAGYRGVMFADAPHPDYGPTGDLVGES